MERIGIALAAEGDLPAALAKYRASLQIKDRLAKSDPQNAAWQNDLAFTYAKLADAFSRQGQVEEAKRALATGRAILVNLTAKYPDWEEWKKNLAWFDGQLAAKAP
jgi:hypothetical protein